MASQSFSFDWLKEKTANLNIEIDSIELLKSCILIVGGRGLDDNKKKILVVDAVTSTVLAEFVEKQTKDVNILRLQYLAQSEKLVYSSGNELRVLSPTVNGSYLMDAALNNHIPANANEPVTIELPLQDAQQIVKVLKAQLNKDEAEINKLGISLPELKAVVTQIEDTAASILKATSNKQLQFPTVTFTAVYSKVKTMLGALTAQLTESEVLSAATAVNETVKLSGKNFEAAPLAKSSAAVAGDEMNTELNRLKSFTFWPRTNKHATPSNLAKAGFYHQPKVEANAQLAGQDRCVCFSCKLVVSDWTNKEHPWREHCTLKPTCAFVQGKTTNNVPLAVSLAALPAEHTDVDIKSISTAPHTELILTTSDEPHNPIITVWDTTAGLKKLYSFTARDGKIHTKKENKPIGDAGNGEKNPERDGTLTGVYLVQCKPLPVAAKPAEEKKGKWVEWCTTDIEVFVGDKGLYPGAKGLVFDLIDKDTICVFLPVIGEVVNLPLSHLLPFKPKANQKVRILKGDLQGEEGVLVALQEQTGVVRLLSTKKIATVDLNCLASMPSPEGSIEKEAEDQDIEDCCAVCLFTLDNSCAFVVYELTNKEPKFMQTYQCPNKGSATLAMYSAQQQRIVAVFKQDNAMAVGSFSFDEEQRRLSEHKSEPLSHDVSDLFVKLMSVELNNSEAVLLVSEKGRFYCLDCETLQLIGTLAQPTESLLLRDATFIIGDNHLVVADRPGRLLNLDVKSTNQQQPTEPLQDNSAPLKIDLGPVTEENLKSLNKFQFDSIEFSSFPPPGVKQVRLQDGTRVKWRIPSESERNEHLFEIEFTKTRTVDCLELEMGLSRAWLGIENEILGPKYMLSLAYQDYTNNKWIKALDRFDLTGLISFGDSDEPTGKLRVGSINVHFTARRLLLTLVSTSRDEQNKLSRRKMDFSKDNIKKVMSKKFDYQTDFDENGLLYWIGSNGNKEEWKNPLTTGKIKLEMSHEKMYSQEMKKEDIIGRAVTQSTYWGGNCPQWFYVDLGSEYRLMCDNYTLRHGYQHANSYIQNWLFQGSNDAENWVTLHEGGETPFAKGFDTKTFHIKDGKEHFRYFRVLQKGNYSMGVGKPGGSAYICVAGFEIYGELYSGASSKPSPNSVNSLAVKFASLKPIEGKSLSEIRALRHSLFESTPFYLSLIKACEDIKTSVGLRQQCLDLLLDVWTRASDKMLSILEAINLEVFIRINIVAADKATALKAGRVLMYAVHVGQELYKKSLLIASLDVLTNAFDHCRTPGGMNQLFAMLYLCWDADRVKAHARAVKLLLNLGHKLFEARSPFYNLLRTHFGLYGYPLELDLFETPSRSDKQKKTEEPLGKSAEALEQQLHIYSLEFASKRRTLTTMLEEINISGDLFGSHEKDVNKAYGDSMAAQIMFHRVRKHLQAMKPNENIVTSADNRLDRWTSAAERLFQCLNQQNDEFEHEEAMLQDLFTHFCVYGTPTLRREAARFLMHQLGSQVSFPSNTLRKFFCSNPEYTRPINLFPQQEVFDTLQEIMGQDRLRFFYVDDLFSMLEELTAATNVSNIDVALVSWVLLLLSNTMSLTPDKAPVHQGSKCRNCNMSPICGVRYRCVNCLDYDLCEQCESDATTHNKSHLFLKIPTALPLPPSSFRGMPPPKDPLLPLMYAQDSTSVSPASLDEQDGYTHAGVSCDGCGKTPIKGIRYKCVHCDEFNFCETCEGKVEHYPLHLFLKIRRPVTTSATTENPKALIPVLLHRGFYPFSQFKSQSSQSFTKLSKSVTDASKMKKDTDRELSPSNLSVSSGKSLRSSAADITKFINEPSEVTQAAGSVFDGRHLRSIFSVISLSARMQPLSPELFLLAMRVLEGLTNQYTPDDIYEDVFKHPKFDEFLRQVSSYPSTFIRSAVLQMVEKLCNIETYNGGKESAQAIRRIRSLLRSKAIKLLLSNDNKNFSADFLLELLLVITYEKELATKPTSTGEASPGPSSSAASSQSAATASDEAENASPVIVRKVSRGEDETEDYALDEIASYLLHYLSRDNPLTASAAARPWCMVLRLLHSVDPKQLCRLPALLSVFHEAILAPEELQVLLLDDFVQLASKLLSTEGLGEVLQSELMGELVVTFPQVHYDTHTLLYLRLLEVMREHFTAAVHYKIEHLFALLQELAAELPDSLALAVHGTSSKGNRLLQVVLDVLNTVFTAPTFTAADRARLLDLANKQKRDKAFTTLFIQWLSSMEQSDKGVTSAALTASTSTALLSTSTSALASSSNTLSSSAAPVTAPIASSALPTATKFDLSKSIVRLIKILSTENEGAKHFLELCLGVLRTKPTSVSIAELCLTLVRNEELAHYLIVELEGYKFLFDQIKSSNSRARSSFLAPAFANILSHSKKNNTANVARPVKSGDKLENLSHVSELLEPKQDKLLARLLKESVIVSSCIWTYNFKRSKEVDEDKFSMTIAIPDNVILREIRIDCINNYNSTSRFPPFITVETGTSLSRLLPVGRFPCKPSALQPNPNTKYTSTFKLPLPGIEVVKFIRMHLQCPNKSAWIALSRIQLLGHSSLLYNAKEEGEDPLLTAQLPLSASLELLEHCVRYDLVQQFLAQQKDTQTFALFLLQILTTKTSQAVQNILSHLAKYDVELSDKLLQQLLTGQTTCHAALAGRLCGLGDADTVNRLNRLRDFVFRELANHTATSLSSHLMPFLNALSDAISSYQRKGLAVQCVVTDQQIELLFNCAINSLEGSLMQQGSLRLLSSLIQSTPEYFQVLLNKFNATVNETAVVKAVVPQSSNRPDQNAFRTLGILASSSSLCATRLLDTGIPERIVSVINEYAQQLDKTHSVEEAQKFLEAALAFFADISHNETVKHWLGKHAFATMFELCSRKDFGSKVHYAIQDVFRVCANLNEQNQEMIAAYLLTQLTQPNSAQLISEFMLQLMVDMFSLEDRVVICLHSLTGSSEELNLLDTSTTARTDPIRLDRKLCHPHLDLDEDQLGATANTLATTGWRTVLAEKHITSGVRRWEVILEKCTSTANIMIGVCERHQKLNAYIGQNNTAKGWSYYGATTGYTYHDGKSNSQYGQKMKEGDVIGVTLDMDEGTLAFTRNGEDLGVAFSTGLAGFELYPAVSLYDVGDRVRFREIEGPTAKQGVLWATKLNSSNPLTYQRSAPLFNVPATTTLAQLAESLTATDPEGAVALFQLPGKPDAVLQSQLTMLELHRLVGSGSELVDLNIEIIKRDDDRSVRAIRPVASTITEQVGSVLKRFADKGGLAQLVDMIDTHLQKKESTSTPSDGKTKSKETDMATWRTWLQLLRKELQVTGFVQMFVRDSDCRALLFRVMTEAQDVKTGPVRDISERLGLAAVPAPSEALLANPMQPLLSALFDLLRTSQHGAVEDSLRVRSEVMQAGVLAALLSLLTDLCDTAPRDPEHPAFSAVVDKWKVRQKDRQDKAKAQSGSDGKFWAKGTGYGTNADDTAPVTWSHEAYVKEQTALAKKIATLLEGAQGFLAVTVESLDQPQPALSAEGYQLIAASSLVPVLGAYLRNDSLLDMGRHFDLYAAVLKTTRMLVLHDALVNLADELPNQSVSLFDLLHKLHTMADVILKRLPKSRLETTTTPHKKEQSSEEDEITLAIEISKTQQLVRQRVLDHRAKTVGHKQPLQPTQPSHPPLDSAKEKELEFSRLYQEQLQELQFDELSMRDESGEFKHHYKSRIKSDTGSAPKKMKRLVQEVGSLSTGLPLFPDSSVFLRVDSDRMDVLKCVITGPKDTPYMNGFFEFDVYCPPEYPSAPPVINLQTTGNGTVRFNPNLYNCGKVCLSLLGTWRGGPNEKWNESTSTLLQVFVSIQSLILVDKPYFNEPGYESSMNTPKGEQQSRQYNEVIRLATIRWAMLEQIRNPPLGFEAVAKTHFKLKRSEIMQQCQLWIKEAKESKSTGHLDKLQKLVDDLKKELQALDPNTPLELTSSDAPVTAPEEKKVDEKEVKRWESALSLQDVVPGFPLALYVKALSLNQDKADLAVNWLLEKGENYLLDHAELFKAEVPKGLNEKKS